MVSVTKSSFSYAETVATKRAAHNSRSHSSDDDGDTSDSYSEFPSSSSSSTVSELDVKVIRPLFNEKAAPQSIHEHHNKHHNHNLEANNNHEGEKISSIDRFQLQISSSIIALILLLNKLPQTQPYFEKFITLQHKYPGVDKYDIGIDDISYVITWIFIITFIRAVAMTYILRPIAISLNVSSHKSVQRFKEQGWYLIYYTTSFIYGFYLYYNSDYFLNNDYIYINWPNDEMNHLFKAYYLIEMACWLQQIFVLNIEAKRKDYSQMFSHHIITCLLVSGSYYYYFTKIGNVIMVMMDVVDIILSLAKVLKYCGFRTVCDVLFEIFLVTWVVLRHGVYNYLLYHCVTKSRGLMESGRCAPGVSQKRCFTDPIMNVFIMLLAGLQCIMIIWMYLIAKVAIKVVSGAGADDVRSDDEED